jgi:uncharacterized protein (DUF1697 family)
MKKYVAFLRGINIGRHHKVPMAELKSEFGKMGFRNISTILNSGNVLFEANGKISEDYISNQLESVFGFPIPTLIRNFDNLAKIYNEHPFERIEVTKDIRLYASFLKNEVDTQFSFPWNSEDGSFHILKEVDNTILSVLDLSKSNTPKAMEALEKHYGKDITTRNWNTIERIFKKDW